MKSINENSIQNSQDAEGYPPIGGESLFVNRMNGGYQLESLPFFLKNATLDDIVSIKGELENALALFERDGDLIELQTDSDTRCLLLTGEPLEEPVVWTWPFRDEHTRRNPGGNSGLPSPKNGNVELSDFKWRVRSVYQLRDMLFFTTAKATKDAKRLGGSRELTRQTATCSK